jgi:hypothetical protein
MVDSVLASDASSARLVECQRSFVNAGIAFSFTQMTGVNLGMCTFNVKRTPQNFGSKLKTLISRIHTNWCLNVMRFLKSCVHDIRDNWCNWCLKWYEFFGD